jgi:RNAse (barnase) inhibitor barstar
MNTLSFSFGKNAEEALQNGFVANIKPGIKSKPELLSCLAQQLQMPNYFGENWDALVDMLGDLSWLKQKHITIYHQDLPALPLQELKTYLEILRASVRDWKPNEVHVLSVTFPVAARDAVIRALDVQEK